MYLFPFSDKTVFKIQILDKIVFKIQILILKTF